MARQQNMTDEVQLADASAVSGQILEPLRQQLSELGLSPYEVRVLLALLRLGSANTQQLAKVTEVPRTSIYQVLEGLASKRLASRVPSEGVAMWTASAREDMFDRLEASLELAHAERLRQHRDHATRARSLLDAWAPDTPGVHQPYVHMLMSPSQVKRAYDEMVASASTELLMFTRPPYVVVPGRPKSVVLDMLARGVTARVLYQADKWEEPQAHACRQELTSYHEAGVEGRLVEDLPIKLVIVDRRVTLVGMSDPVAPEAGYPVGLLIEHPGYSAIQAHAFEHLWESSRPLTFMPPATAGDDPDGLADIAEQVDGLE